MKKKTKHLNERKWRKGKNTKINFNSSYKNNSISEVKINKTSKWRKMKKGENQESDEWKTYLIIWRRSSSFVRHDICKNWSNEKKIDNFNFSS